MSTTYDRVHGAAEPSKIGQQMEIMINKIVAAGMNQRAAHTVVSTITRELSLLGVKISASGTVDPFELSSAIRSHGQHLSIERRMALKGMLYQCGLIPA